jgi:hypothetical protein
MTPVRLQLSRARGFRLQAVSLAINGLPARKVDRTTEFGNPFRVTKGGIKTAAEAVAAFRELVMGDTKRGRRWRAHIRAELAGVNPSCWCKSGAPCHGQIILDILAMPLPAKIPVCPPAIRAT